MAFSRSSRSKGLILQCAHLSRALWQVVQRVTLGRRRSLGRVVVVAQRATSVADLMPAVPISDQRWRWRWRWVCAHSITLTKLDRREYCHCDRLRQLRHPARNGITRFDARSLMRRSQRVHFAMQCSDLQLAICTCFAERLHPSSASLQLCMARRSHASNKRLQGV